MPQEPDLPHAPSVRSGVPAEPRRSGAALLRAGRAWVGRYDLVLTAALSLAIWGGLTWAVISLVGH